MKKFALALMVSVAMVFGVGMVANAYPPSDTPPVASDTTPAAGESFTVEAECSPVGDEVVFTLNSEPPQIEVATCAAKSAPLVAGILLEADNGVVSATFTAPAAAGTYTIVLTGAAVGSASITVPADPGGGLPATGSNGVGSMTLVAIGLFGAGAGLFAVSQMRRRQTVTA